MKFIPMKNILEMAEEKNIAYGAYVITSSDIAVAVIEAGKKMGTPLILIGSPECCELMGGYEATTAMVEMAAKGAQIPVALHLDHCNTYEECVEAIEAGFSSVMIDGSALPIEQNIALTKKVVDYAHKVGVTVEGELGRLVGEEGNLIVKGPDAAQTDPEEALRFVQETGVDCLAVSIGTQHGAYTCTPKLNIERLKKIHEITKIPLVLHGGSGTPIEQVQEAIKCGIRKINVGTDLLTAYIDSYIEKSKEEGFKYNLAPFYAAQDSVTKVAEGKIKDFLCE